MASWIQTVITIVCAMLGSSGLWAYLQRRSDKKDASKKMVMGLGHDRIMELGMKYVERKWVTQSEYENLRKYLYEPYKAMGGNGSAERVMREVDKLEIRPDSYAV